jgi:hypothetical protein
MEEPTICDFGIFAASTEFEQCWKGAGVQEYSCFGRCLLVCLHVLVLLNILMTSCKQNHSMIQGAWQCRRQMEQCHQLNLSQIEVLSFHHLAGGGEQ